MEYALEVVSLGKNYGNKTAIDSVTFRVRKGSCFGLLGPNGAGKSTSMKIISGVLSADRGDISVFGRNLRTDGDEIKGLMGYVPQSITLFEKLSAYDNLMFFGNMYGVGGSVLKKRIADVLEKVGLSDRSKDEVTTFSGGMKRRINIAAALLHEPQLLIFDEPTVGIDPQSRNHIFEMIRDLKNQGVSIVYSTHYMEEVEALCDDLAIIDHGKVIAEGSLEGVLDRYGSPAVYLEGEDIIEPIACPSAVQATSKGRGWLYETEQGVETVRHLAEACMQRGASVNKLEIVRPTLEKVFLNLTGTSLRDE